MHNINCVPCARRKVRCDRSVPCANCKRRNERCEYPRTVIHYAGQSSSAPFASPVRGLQERVLRLENYVRYLGGDLQNLDSPQSRSSNHERNASQKRLRRHDENTADSPRVAVSPSPTRPSAENLSGTGTLVEVDKETTYIEAPVWYSWEDAIKHDNASSHTANGESKDAAALGYSSILLTNVFPSGRPQTAISYPTPGKVAALWPKFLSNVHPLTKVLFAWEKEPLIRKASENPQQLSKAEQSLITAICFITVLSLSEDQCEHLVQGQKRQGLDRLQAATEASLLQADFVTTTQCIVLQAYMLYLIAMQTRARPSALFSLMGIATRIAERIGIHRDGTALGLSVFRAEERRRIWWRMQHLEIFLGRIVGSISMNLWGPWDSQMPASIEDEDVGHSAVSLPAERPGLTSMSHCLWVYFTIDRQRTQARREGKTKPCYWSVSSALSISQKIKMVDHVKAGLREKFLQYCEPLEPFHVHLQISVQIFFTALERTLRQPSLANAKISQVPWQEREELLGICKRGLEYCIMGLTTDSIRHFAWQTETYFQWPAFAYVVIEAYHRATESSMEQLWSLIERACRAQPQLLNETNQPELSSLGRLVIAAWQKREDHLSQSNIQDADRHGRPSRPDFVNKIMENLGIGREQEQSLPDFQDSWFDFDMIDWSYWESLGGP